MVLADDDVLLREGLASLLDRSASRSSASAGDPAELIALVREHRPDLAIVDIRMPPEPPTEGLDAARVIREEFPETAILVLSAHVEVEQATDLLASGRRCGYLLKSRVTDVDEFIETLDRIVKGGSVVDPALVQELSPRAASTTRWRFSRRVSARCSRSWPRAAPTPASPTGSGSPRARSRSTCAASYEARLPETEDDQRRVLAVITFLDAR